MSTFDFRNNKSRSHFFWVLLIERSADEETAFWDADLWSIASKKVSLIYFLHSSSNSIFSGMRRGESETIFIIIINLLSLFLFFEVFAPISNSKFLQILRFTAVVNCLFALKFLLRHNNHRSEAQSSSSSPSSPSSSSPLSYLYIKNNNKTMKKFFLLLLFFFLLFSFACGGKGPFYWFTQKLDHTNPQNTQKWQQRYTVNDTYYRQGGPVFCKFLLFNF